MSPKLHNHSNVDEESYLTWHIYDKHFQEFDQLEEVYSPQKYK